MSSTPQKKPMKISGNFTDSDWKVLRKNPEIVRALTDIDFDALPERWNEVITVFENRIKTRFLNPIDKIKDGDVRSGEGFSITLIAVVLMEALAAFQFGKIYNEKIRRDFKREPHEYASSSGLYKDLFNSSVALKNGASSNLRTKNFYSKIRCGLVHECRTKGKEIIISEGHAKNTNPEKYYFKNDCGEIIFNRDKFISSLKEHITDYITKLNQPHRIQLRKNLALKIDEICNIEHVWYFTYGSNLDEKQMNKRLSKLGDFYLYKQLCHIDDYEFVYNKKSKIDNKNNNREVINAKGNIQESPGKVVYGVAYLIKEETFKRFIDDNEKGYDRKLDLTAYYKQNEKENHFSVRTVASTTLTDKLPLMWYRDTILEGAKSQNIDSTYIDNYLKSDALD